MCGTGSVLKHLLAFVSRQSLILFPLSPLPPLCQHMAYCRAAPQYIASPSLPPSSSSPPLSAHLCQRLPRLGASPQRLCYHNRMLLGVHPE